MSRDPRSDPRLLRAAHLGSWLTLSSLLYLVDLFLPWHQVCSSPVLPFHPASGQDASAPLLHALPASCTYSASAWDASGVVAAVLAAILLLWEAIRVARAEVGLSTAYRSLVSAAISFGVLLFGAVHVVGQLTWLSPTDSALLYGGTFVWLSLALALLIGLLGLVHWGIWEREGPALPRAAGGQRPQAGSPRVAAGSGPGSAPRACPNCGRGAAEDASFCSGCGQALPPTA